MLLCVTASDVLRVFLNMGLGILVVWTGQLKVRPRWASEHPNIPRVAPPESVWRTGLCAASVDDWLKNRASNDDKSKIRDMFQQMQIPIEIPEKA